VGIGADCKGRVRGSFLLFPLKAGRNRADNPYPYAVHNENSSRYHGNNHGLYEHTPTGTGSNHERVSNDENRPDSSTERCVVQRERCARERLD